MTVYLSQFIGDKQTVLDFAMGHPAMAQKRKPNIDIALKCVVNAIEHFVTINAKEVYEPLIQDAVDMYEIMNGEFKTVSTAEQAEWSEGMDNTVEAVFEPLTQMLSADWLARYTIDTHMEEENAVSRLADALGKELFKQLSYGKEPGAVLSNAGILRTDVDIAFAEAMKPKSAEQKTARAGEVKAMMDNVIARMHAQLGSDFDIMNVAEELDNVCDDDEILAGGSGQRLGMTEDDLQTVQMFVVEVGKDKAAETMLEMLQSYKPGQAAAAPPPAPVVPPMVHTNINVGSVAPPPPPPPAARAETTGAAFDGAKVLTLFKDHSSMKDTDMAAALGVSRSTYLNWISGKTSFAPDDGQRETLRNAIVNDVNALHEALCLVDGVPYEREYD